MVAAALSEAGTKVKSVFDLVRTGVPYPSAIPVLVACLSKVSDPWIKEGIVRALTVKRAGPAVARRLIDEYLRIDPEDEKHAMLKWAIGNALSVVGDDSFVEDLIAIATDTRHGRAREMVTLGLGRMDPARVTRVLMDLLDDDVVDGHAVIALGELRAKRAERRLGKIAEGHPRDWVRKEAMKALRKIEKAKSSESRTTKRVSQSRASRGRGTARSPRRTVK